MRKANTEQHSKWDERKEYALQMIFQKVKIKDIASELEVSERQIYRWQKDEEFIHRYNILVAESVRGIKRNVLALGNREAFSGRDLLDWLKYMHSETEEIDYTDPHFHIPPERLHLYMTKATRRSLERRGKQTNRAAPTTAPSDPSDPAQS